MYLSFQRIVSWDGKNYDLFHFSPISMSDPTQEMNILAEVSRNVESETMEYESFYKEQIRNNMQVEIEIRRVVRDICNQQLVNEKLNQDVERKSGEVI